MKIKFDCVLEQTDKSVLIKVNDHVTWIPINHATFGHKWVEVSDWLHPRLIWQRDYTDIDYVIDDNEEYRKVRNQLEADAYDFRRKHEENIFRP